MTSGDVAQRLVALRAAAPFQRLEAGELLLIAQHARSRMFAPGKVVIPAGVVAEALFVAPQGDVTIDGVAAPVVFDAPGLLFGLAARADYVAGPDGVEALIIAKPHVFTIARECPEFVVGLRDLAGPAS